MEFIAPREFSLKSLLNATPLSKRAQSHITKVYSTLALGILATAFGVYFSWHIFHLDALLCGLGSIGCLLGVKWTTSSHKVVTPLRAGLMGGFSFLKGCLMADFIHHVLYTNPGVLPTAFFGTLVIFVCFSGCALFAQRRSYLYLGGFLGSILSFTMLASLANLFFRSSFIFDALVYIELLALIGYIVFDTQFIVESFEMGCKDFLSHAVDLYVDLIGIFIRLMIILNKKENNKKRRSS